MWRFCEFFKKTENAILSKSPLFLRQFPHFFSKKGGKKMGKSDKTSFQFGQGDFAKGLVKGHFSKK